MNYHDALRYLYGLVDYEKRRIERYSPREFKLERVTELLAKLGNPHLAYPTLHVAGTKGKGSVSVMLSSIAQTAGLRVGLYTSPHLHTYRERIQINRELISRSAMAALVTELQPIADSVPGLTTFEVTTALAFLYFARQAVDLAVLEVGLGGRLDATNVIIPQVSVITSLSLDHTYLLGNTLAEIAFEKAGIIKPGVPVVTSPQHPEALEVLRRIAAERRAALTVVGQDWTWVSGERSLAGQQLTVQRTEGDSPFSGVYTLNLIGAFQQENAATTVATAAVLRELGCSWATPESVRSALAHIEWPGRMEIVCHDPLTVVDCAHNPYSVESLVRSLELWFPGTRWVLIFGASSDKDIDGMLKTLLPFSDHVVVTRSYHPRAVTPYTLADKCADLGLGAEIAVNPLRALEQATRHVKPGWGIIATGSVFLVSEIREGCTSCNAVPLPQGDWVDEPWQAP